MWLVGLVYIAEGLARLVGFGFWLPSWTTRINFWFFLLDD